MGFQFGAAGGKTWNVPPALLNLGTVSYGSTRCVGSIVGADLGIGASTWVVRTFLRPPFFSFSSD